jgi:hypothetical protein
MTKFRFCATALGFLVMTTSAATAGPMPCGIRDGIVKLLDGKYKEQLSGAGLGGQSSMVELFVSEKGSFTVLATNTQGISCIIATGQDWQIEKPVNKSLTAL